MTKILTLPGSLRRGSYNRRLLSIAAGLAPTDMTFQTLDLDGLPVFNEDIETSGDPVAVRRLKQAVSEADGLLIATPEYNGSLPAALKNAIDWASRPYLSSALIGKPCALIGVSVTPGAARTALAHLHHVLVRAGADPLVHSVGVGVVQERLDAEGHLIDVGVRSELKHLLAELGQAAQAVSSEIDQPVNRLDAESA